MKKLSILSLLLVAPFVSADPINVQMECPQGGTRSLTGNYAPLTGKFSTKTILDNCINKRGVNSDGTVNSEGIFKVTPGKKAQLEATINTNISRNSDKNSTQQTCERTLSGTYDLASNKLDGSESSTCEKSGQIYAPILELVAGLSESEALESLDDITLENLKKLDKEEVKSHVQTLLEGNEISSNKSRSANFAQTLVNGLTSTQQKTMQSSAKAACTDLNYPSMWEYLGLCS